MSIVIAPTLTQREMRWTAWKVMASLKNIVHQHEEDADKYVIWGVDCNDAIITYIYKGTVPEDVINSGYTQELNDEDKTDFLDNYLPTSNRTSVQTTIPKVGIGVDSLRPRSIRFTATANSTTAHYFVMDESLAFRGGYIYSTGQLGDHIRLTVVDKDNLLGYGSDLELKEYIKDLSVFPNTAATVLDVNVSSLIPAGLYFKIYYTNTHATIDAKVAINFLSYVAEA